MKEYSGKPAASFRFRNIKYSKRDWKAVITINRPKVLNALNLATLRELGIAFEDASWDDGVAVVIITGAGEKAFCTGADLNEWNDSFLSSPGDFHKWMGVFIETFERLRNIGKPTIARLNGIAVGGGNELQMSCDLAVAAEDIYIRHVGVAHGSVPSAGATQWLPLFAGDRRAREILFLCEKIPARRALEWGLVNRVVPRGDLDHAVDTMAAQLVQKLPESLRYTKQQLNFWRDLSWALTIGHARDWLTIHTGSEEVRHAVSSFVKKQPVQYTALRKSGRVPAKQRKRPRPPSPSR